MRAGAGAAATRPGRTPGRRLARTLSPRSRAGAACLTQLSSFKDPRDISGKLKPRAKGNDMVRKSGALLGHPRNGRPTRAGRRPCRKQGRILNLVNPAEWTEGWAMLIHSHRTARQRLRWLGASQKPTGIFSSSQLQPGKTRAGKHILCAFFNMQGSAVNVNSKARAGCFALVLGCLEVQTMTKRSPEGPLFPLSLD